MKPALFLKTLESIFCILAFSAFPIAAGAGDTDTDSGTGTDSEAVADADSETTSDTDNEPGGETIMYFPMEIDENPYAGKVPPPSKTKGTEKQATIPAPKAEVANPPWVESPSDPDAPAEGALPEEEEGITYLPPPPPPPAAEIAVESPCAAVTCSARGTCVMKNNQPTCACRQGYVPDAVNGLSCVPETPAPPQPAWDMDTYYTNMDIAFGEYSIQSKLQEYRSMAARGEIKGTFAHYLGRSFKRAQNWGTVAMSFGIAAFAGGLSMHMLYAGYPDKGGLLAGAVILDLVGAGLIGTGAVMLTSASTRTKKLDKFEKSARGKLARAVMLPPQMQFGQDSASLSLGLIFF